MANITIIPPVLKNQTKNSEINNRPRRRVAGYARVSTDKDEQLGSYEAQIAYYTRYIESRPEWQLVDVYTDEGITGTSTKHREGFNRMIANALDGNIDLIVTKSVSRFARNTVDSLVTIRKLKEVGCECYFEKENIFTFDGKGELLLTIMSSLAQEESRSISENVIWGVRESMRKGKAYVPYTAFLGYDRSESGEMKINPKQAIIVRRIYGMYLQGLSPYRIAATLMEEGVPSPSGNEKWFYSTVCSILTNEKYKGDALRQKTYTKDFLSKQKMENKGELQQYYISEHHEAIITPEVFQQVQDEIKRRGTAGAKQAGQYLFSQRVCCGDCGTWFGPKKWHPNTKSERIVWQCNAKYKKGKPRCSTPYFSEDELKQYFITAVNRFIAEKGVVTESFEKVVSEEIRIDGFQAEKNGLEHEISIVKARIEAVTDMNEECMEEYSQRLLVAEKRLGVVEKEISDRKKRRGAVGEYLKKVQSRSDVVKEFEADLWYNLADHITVFSKDDVRVTFKDGTVIKAS